MRACRVVIYVGCSVSCSVVHEATKSWRYDLRGDAVLVVRGGAGNKAACLCGLGKPMGTQTAMKEPRSMYPLHQCVVVMSHASVLPTLPVPVCCLSTQW